MQFQDDLIGIVPFQGKKTFKAGIAADQQSKGLALSRVETGRGGGGKGRLSRKGKIRHGLLSLLPLGRLYRAREVLCNDTSDFTEKKLHFL